MAKFIIEAEDLGTFEALYKADNYPEVNKLYLVSDGVITNLAFKNSDDCVMNMPIPQGILLEQKARETEADVCSSMGAMLEDYKNEILDAIGKAKNTEPSRTIHNSGISEDALLKIVAVAQNPELIKDMPYERD